MGNAPNPNTGIVNLTRTPFVWTDENNFRLAIYAVTLFRRQSIYAQWLLDGGVRQTPFELLASALETTEAECAQQWARIQPQYQHIVDNPEQFSIRDITYQGVRLAYLDLVPDSFIEYRRIAPVYFCRNCRQTMYNEDLGVHDTVFCGDQWDFNPNAIYLRSI